jgi:glycosyltransferase involved in cell wall biosynthesis
MNVCFVIPNFNFFKTHRADLVKKLSTHHEMHVITDVSMASKHEINEFSMQNIKIHHLQARNGSMSLKSYFQYFSSLKKKIDSLNLNYIFYTTLEISFFGALLNNFINIKKSFFLVTGVGSTFYSNKLKYRIFRVVQKIVFKICALNNNYLFIFQNNDDLKLFTKRGFANKKSSMVIPGNGINTSQFPFFSRDYLQDPIFLFASKLLISKGVEEYLGAARHLINKNLSAKFLIAGKYNKAEPDSISPSSYAALQNDSQVTYLGELSYEQMSEAFNNSTIFVLPSYGEGLPKVLLEAAATGLPLITTDVPGCRECIENEKNGKLIKPRNYNELKDAMESFILTDVNTMHEYSKKSSSIVNNKFSLDVVAEQYIGLIK